MLIDKLASSRIYLWLMSLAVAREFFGGFCCFNWGSQNNGASVVTQLIQETTVHVGVSNCNAALHDSY